MTPNRSGEATSFTFRVSGVPDVPGGNLLARVNVQLAHDVRDVLVDAALLDRWDELSADLLIAQAQRHPTRHLQLAGGQPAAARDRHGHRLGRRCRGFGPGPDQTGSHLDQQHHNGNRGSLQQARAQDQIDQKCPNSQRPAQRVGDLATRSNSHQKFEMTAISARATLDGSEVS